MDNNTFCGTTIFFFGDGIENYTFITPSNVGRYKNGKKTGKWYSWEENGGHKMNNIKMVKGMELQEDGIRAVNRDM